MLGARPVCFGGCPHDVEYLGQLIHLSLTVEQRTTQQHFSKDAADAPDVDLVTVQPGEVEQLRRPIPDGDDLRRHGPVGRAVAASQTEITQLDLTFCVDEDVCRRQIPVNEIPRVHDLQTLQYLLHHALDVRLSQLRMGTQKLLEIGVHEIHHQVDEVALGIHIDQPHDVFVSDFLHDFDFPENGEVDAGLAHRQPAAVLLLVDTLAVQLDPLDGHYLVCRLVQRLCDRPIRPGADVGVQQGVATAALAGRGAWRLRLSRRPARRLHGLGNTHR
mmetsp:Transcript_40085/g.100317  ORF Transcript_40085/g.100317 Transcript_40085/m.100317 type:complete len:274 (-) Transcript_40085:80-901(-)